MDAATKLTPTAPVAELSASSSPGGDFRDQASDQNDTPMYRLVIEEGSTQGSFVYKTVDRVTGEVIRQLPRERLVEMISSDAYSSGSVINTTA